MTLFGCVISIFRGVAFEAIVSSCIKLLFIVQNSTLFFEPHLQGISRENILEQVAETLASTLILCQ